MFLTLRKYGLIGTGAALLAALLYVSFKTDPVTVDLAPVIRGPMQITVNADGKTQIRNIYEVAAPISGTAQRSPVAVGDKVVKGETVVAVVEPVSPSLLDSRSRIQAEAAIREAEANVRLSDSQVRQAKEELTYAQSQFDRVKSLLERGVATVTQMEDVAQQLAVNQAAHDAALSGREMAASSLERARAALVEPGEDAAAREGGCCVTLHAPISGVVLEVDQISARPVTTGTRLLSVGQPDDLEIVADLLSADVVRLSPGARAIVERWGGPEALEARLRSVDPTARTKVSALGIEEQRVDAVFDLVSAPQVRPGLGDGFAVFLRIVEWESDDAVQVPISALFRHGDGWAVFLAKENVARLTMVEVGRRNGQTAQILSGLVAGDDVVSHPGESIADGVAIVDRASL